MCLTPTGRKLAVKRSKMVRFAENCGFSNPNANCLRNGCQTQQSDSFWWFRHVHTLREIPFAISWGACRARDKLSRSTCIHHTNQCKLNAKCNLGVQILFENADQRAAGGSSAAFNKVFLWNLQKFGALIPRAQIGCKNKENQLFNIFFSTAP